MPPPRLFSLRTGESFPELTGAYQEGPPQQTHFQVNNVNAPITRTRFVEQSMSRGNAKPYERHTLFSVPGGNKVHGTTPVTTAGPEAR